MLDIITTTGCFLRVLYYFQSISWHHDFFHLNENEFEILIFETARNLYSCQVFVISLGTDKPISANFACIVSKHFKQSYFLFCSIKNSNSRNIYCSLNSSSSSNFCKQLYFKSELTKFVLTTYSSSAQYSLL